VRAAIITGQSTIEFQEMPSPVAGPGGVVVDVGYCGICGSDVHAFAHGGPYPPTLCGHEWMGVVSACGPGVAAGMEGERVSVAIFPACGQCPECRAGHTDLCVTSLGSIGTDPVGSRHGAYAPQIAASTSRVVTVPSAISDAAAAMIEPATVAYHGVRRSGIGLGDTVVVQGAGPIGALALQWAKVHGAGQLVVVEPGAARHALALELGADVVVAPGEEAEQAVRERTGGLGADVVIECAGVPAAIQSAVDLARRGGQVMLIGLSDLPATITPTTWLVKEVVVRSSIAYVRPDFDHCIAMLADGRIRAEPLHTSTVGLDGLIGAFEELAAGAGDHTKILVDPRGAGVT